MSGDKPQSAQSWDAPPNVPRQYSQPDFTQAQNTVSLGVSVPFAALPPRITESTPRDIADALVRRRADICYAWSVAGAGLFAVFSVCVWLSILSPGDDLFLAFLGEAAGWIIGLCGMIAVIGLGVSVQQTLQVLRDRALYAQPPLSRTATDIQTMHMWPVRNIVGPVVALAESGVDAVKGPGRLVWYLTCLLWPLALIWFVAADVTRTGFQAGIITTLAFSATAVTARLLRYVLAPEEVHRHIPAGAGREHVEPGFWARGFIPSEAETGQPAGDSSAVDKQLFEGTSGNFVDDYYK